MTNKDIIQSEATMGAENGPNAPGLAGQWRCYIKGFPIIGGSIGVCRVGWGGVG